LNTFDECIGLEVDGLAAMSLNTCNLRMKYLSNCDLKQINKHADIPTYSAQLHDEASPLWKRYEALFTLRNIGEP
jgi:hypothetical protein